MRCRGHRGHLKASGCIWEHLRAESIWGRLGASGSIWRHLGASGSTWEHLARTDAQTQAQLDDCANQAVFLQEAKIAEIYVQPHVPDNASSPRAQHGKGQEQINE